MTNCTRYLGLDVHAETITAAIAEGRGRIRSLGKFPNRPEAVRKLIEKLGGGRHLKVCYEAGPTGYALYWQLSTSCRSAVWAPPSQRCDSTPAPLRRPDPLQRHVGQPTTKTSLLAADRIDARTPLFLGREFDAAVDEPFHAASARITGLIVVCARVALALLIYAGR